MLALDFLLFGVFAPQAGPLASLIGPSAHIAPVTRGLAVDFVISPSGSVTVAGNDLKAPSWSGSCALSEDELAFAGGNLTANIGLANHSGTSIQGVRFDFVNATETYKAKKPDGTEENRSRLQTVSFSSPCYFGDLADGESSISIPGSAKGIKLNPETVEVTVHAVVSGISFKKQFLGPKKSLKGCGVVVDSSGDVIVGEANNQALWRFSEDGDFKGEFGKLPTYGREVALNPATGEFLVGLYNSHNEARVAPDGTTSSAFAANLSEWPGAARFDGKGRLFLKVGNKISTFADYALSAAGSNKIGGLNIRDYDPFDFQGDQTAWVLASNNLVKSNPSFASAVIVVKPGTGLLGEILPTQSPALRCSPLGELFAAEDGISGKYLPRISVFDAQGRFVRTFGLAGQNANPHQYLPGQLHSTPRDFAFGKAGQVYVTQYDAGCGLSEFVEF